MNTDMQRLLAKTIFSGRVPTRTFHHAGSPLYRHRQPGALLETTPCVRRYMTMAAAVSKTWRKQFQRYFKRQMRNIAAMTWRRAIQRGLRLCHIDSYGMPFTTHHTPQAWLPDFTVVEWHLRLDDTLRASLEITRQRMGAAHALSAQYALRRDYGVAGERLSEVHTMRVPDACWIVGPPGSMIIELERWDFLQTETLREWLRAQRMRLVEA
jgi:hypothetical protein